MREWLRSARKKHNLTMKEFAQNLHISESYYCAIERGYRKTTLDAKLIRGIADTLGVTVEEVLNADEANTGIQKRKEVNE